MTTETRIDLLRHGEAAGGQCLRGARSDAALTRQGWAQLEAAVATGGDWDVVIASELARSQRFARALAERLECELRVDGRFNEYDFGAWDGLPFEDLWRDHGDTFAAFLGDPDAVTPPGGETGTAFRARVRQAWEALLAAHEGRRVLLIGHGGVLRQIVADVLGAGGHAHTALEWPPAALSRVRVVTDPPQPRASALVFHARG